MDDQPEPIRLDQWGEWSVERARKFGRHLSRVRRRSGFSQRGLAEKAGLSHSTIARLERAQKSQHGKPVRPSTETLQRISVALASDKLDEEPTRPEIVKEIYADLLVEAGLWERELERMADRIISLERDPTTGQFVPRFSEAPVARADASSVARTPIEDEIVALLAQMPDVSIALTSLARGVDDWDEEDREYVVRQISRLAKRYGRSPVAC